MTFKASSLFLGEANALCGKAHSEDGISHQQGQLGSWGVGGGGAVLEPDAPSEEGAGIWVRSGWRKSRRSSNGRETGPWEA